MAYNGMKWHKCDLHMHTPAYTSAWRGEKVAEREYKAFAEKYIRQCYECGLDAIAITEHNFLAKEIVSEIYSATDRLSKKYDRTITIFPGFEFGADIGKGIHVVCIFEPGTDLEIIAHILTECGISYPRTDAGTLLKSDRKLYEIIDIVQHDNKGLVIIPHVFDEGLFDNKKLSNWLQREEYLNPNLLAVEVPKPVSEMSIEFQNLFNCTEQCLSEWRRRRPIATIMSSDCKAITKEECAYNYIGWRYTWINMTLPSIESLRQAFLDHDSRIKLPKSPSDNLTPDDKQTHSRIISIDVENEEFLDNQIIEFSSGLNCIIGGRGTGKSTLIEGMRIAFGKDNDPKIDDNTRLKIERIRNSLRKNSKSKIVVEWRNRDGIKDKLCYESHNNEVKILENSIEDLNTYLDNIPIQFFSQQQLNHLTEKDASTLLPLLDDFIKDELSSYLRNEILIKENIDSLFNSMNKLNSEKRHQVKLKQELADLRRQWDERTALVEDAKQNSEAKKALKYLNEISSKAETDKSNISIIVDNIVNSHVPLKEQTVSWLESEIFIEFDNRLLNSKKELRDEIIKSTDKFISFIKDTLASSQWVKIRERIEELDRTFEEKCIEKGISLEDISRVKEIGEQIRNKEEELKDIEAIITTLELEVNNIQYCFEKLHNCWEEIFNIRKYLAGSINSLAMNNGKPVIEIIISYSADRVAFLNEWTDLSKDARTRIGRNWDNLGERIFDHFMKHCKDNAKGSKREYFSVWDMVEKLLNNDCLVETIINKDDDVNLTTNEIKDFLRTNIDLWRKAQLFHVNDMVDIILYRPDGTIAGRISDGSLSDGQRNIAALAVLLSQGEGPIVFDQPEDELDSNFIYSDLVPMIRRLKNKRQIIIVTHNANIPVNGDAELVYALETRDGKGIRLAEGGLDINSVSKAVLEIMEGSEEAFMKRKEKYSF